MLMLLPRFRRPRLRPDSGALKHSESASDTGPRLAAAPFSECFHSKNSSGPFKRPSRFTDICIQEEIR